jgi:hypothetical protein
VGAVKLVSRANQTRLVEIKPHERSAAAHADEEENHGASLFSFRAIDAFDHITQD